MPSHILFKIIGNNTCSHINDPLKLSPNWMVESFFVGRGLRKHLLPIVSGSLEHDRQHQMTFEQFFLRASGFYALKVQHVRCLDTFVLHRLYLPETATSVCYVIEAKWVVAVLCWFLINFLHCVSIASCADHCTGYHWHVCLSVCLSHAGIVSKWHKLGSQNLHQWIDSLSTLPLAV